MTAQATLPAGFEDLAPWAETWAIPGREDRYAMRLSKTIEELEAFYDEVAPRAEAAIDFLNTRELNSLSEQETRLKELLYSFVLVSYAVNIFKQPRIPDSGAAFFTTVLEPAV